MSLLTIFKQVPQNRIPEYVQIGWETTCSPQVGNCLTLSRSVETGLPRDSHESMAFREPYLVQRAIIRRPLGEYVGSILSRSVEMDYMGAAEFEYGALPLSLRQVQATFPLFTLHTIVEISATVGINTTAQPLQMYANFDSDEQRSQYVSWIQAVLSNKLQMHETLQLPYSNGLAHVESGKTDFWWDIRNNVFMSFDKKYMKRLPSHLQASFASMEANLKKESQ